MSFSWRRVACGSCGMAMYLLSASTQADFGLVLLECNCMMSGFASDPPRPELEKQLCVTPADVKVPTVPAYNEQHKSATPPRISQPHHRHSDMCGSSCDRGGTRSGACISASSECCRAGSASVVARRFCRCIGPGVTASQGGMPTVSPP